MTAVGEGPRSTLTPIRRIWPEQKASRAGKSKKTISSHHPRKLKAQLRAAQQYSTAAPLHILTNLLGPQYTALVPMLCQFNLQGWPAVLPCKIELMVKRKRGMKFGLKI